MRTLGQVASESASAISQTSSATGLIELEAIRLNKILAESGELLASSNFLRHQIPNTLMQS
jgi:hypothetical protein